MSKPRQLIKKILWNEIDIKENNESYIKSN